MEPKLNLNYSNQAGNGWLGAGWNLGGLGNVSRCPRTMAQDGVRGGVNFDLNDRYCLDGQRLILVSGTYGAAGSEYRTERDTFSKITAVGTAGNGVTSFRVKTKAGLTIEYGNTPDSRVEAVKVPGATTAWAEGTVRIWAMNKVVDTNNNYYAVQYVKDSTVGEHYPSKIEYTGNAANPSLDPLFSIHFISSIQPRQDVQTAYQAGAQISIKKRLENIQTYIGSSMVSDYKIQYVAMSTAAEKSRVSNIVLINASGQQTTQFDYSSNGNLSFSEPQRWTSSFNASTWNATKNFRSYADMNGDGLLDVVGIADDGIYIGVNSGNGSFAPQLWTTAFNAAGWNAATNTRFFVDVTGDGLPDVVGIGDIAIYVGVNTGNSFLPPQPWTTAFNASSWNVTTNPRSLVDMNGDGLPDMVGIASDGVYIGINTGTSFLPPQRWTTEFNAAGWNAATNTRFFVDVTGDGLPDVVGIGDIAIYVGVNTGNSFLPPQPWTTAFNAVGWSATVNPRTLVDVNGDGLPDMVGIASDGIYVGLSTVKTPNMLTSVANSINASTSVSYARLEAYTQDRGTHRATFPMMDIQSPMHVVGSVVLSNGSTGVVSTKFTYGGLKAEAGTGRGMLGFRWVQSQQAETGLTSYTEYLQSWPYTGLPKLVKKGISGGGNNGILRQVASTYGCSNISSENSTLCAMETGNRYFVFTKQSVESSWDYNGTSLPVVTTTTDYDNWGNATKVDVSTDDGFKKSTINSYSNDSTNWYLGRLLTATVTSTSP
ncbi:hypothetical protein D3C87_292960 [compost metagenome]